MRCQDCRFFDAWKQDPRDGFCRVGGPAVIAVPMGAASVRTMTCWPSVSAASDWCGRFEARLAVRRCDHCRWWRVAEPAPVTGEPRGLCTCAKGESGANTAGAYYCGAFEPHEEGGS